MATSITFNSNNLQTDSIVTSVINHESSPQRSQNLLALAYADKSVVAFESYPSRKISISGQIIGTNIADLDSKLDVFRGYFSGKDKDLDIGYAGGTRRYIATLSSISITRPGGLLHADFAIEFVCTKPFGRNTTATSALSATGRTLASYVDEHTFIGSAPYQLPIITITYTAVTDGDNPVYFTNSDNGQGITITGQTFVDDDVLVINCEENTVTLNDEEIDFLGAFTEFESGAEANMSYTDDFTARTFDIDIDYYARYY